MRKKLTRVGNSLALVLERPILDLLGVDGQSELDVTLDGRRLIVRLPQEDNVNRYHIWIKHLTEANAARINADAPAAHYALELLRDYSSTEAVYALRHPPTSQYPDEPVKMGAYRESASLQNPKDYRVIFKGESALWEITTTKYNEAAGRVEIGLKQVQ